MTQPSTPPSTPPVIPPLPQPLPPGAGIGLILAALLSRPASVLAALQKEDGTRAAAWLAITGLLALGAYGLVVGMFSGHEQLWLAPLKISLGAALTLLICLPSLFIFSCLTGAEVTLRGVMGFLCAMFALLALLLIGFAPVAWVFSESTESVTFIGTLHLAFWLIALGFGFRLLRVFTTLLQVRDRSHLRVWAVLILLVSLQMTTALRPLVGTSPHRLPTQKKFFLEHWWDHLTTPRGEKAARN